MTTSTEPEHLDLRDQVFELEAKNVPEQVFGSLRLHWIDAANDDVSADLACGAGMGNPYIEMSMTYRGRRVRAQTDVRPFFTAWITAARRQIDEAIDPERAWERQVRDILVGTDGKIKDVAPSEGLPKMIDFAAHNGICRDRIKNRAEQQGFDIVWGSKMTGTVKFDA